MLKQSSKVNLKIERVYYDSYPNHVNVPPAQDTKRVIIIIIKNTKIFVLDLAPTQLRCVLAIPD